MNTTRSQVQSNAVYSSTNKNSLGAGSWQRHRAEIELQRAKLGGEDDVALLRVVARGQ